MINYWPHLNSVFQGYRRRGSDFLNHPGCPIVMEQMTALIPCFIAGLVLGSLFGVQTLLMLALAVFIEVGGSVVLLGTSTGLIWLVVSQIALQIGYLGGMCLRSILERAGIVIISPQSRRS
jgi:hypothetical protein